jgi:hypothetical protein
VNASSAHEHGSLGEEAARLAEAVQEWLGGRAGERAQEWLAGARAGERAQEWLAGAAGRRARDVWADATAPPGGSPECQACPFCQLLRIVRSVRPEVFEHVSDATASLMAALRELCADSAGHGDASPRRGGVERIDLG